MKVKGSPAALVAITATLTLLIGSALALTARPEHHTSPQVHPQAVDNPQALSPFTELRELRASRSRPLATKTPTAVPSKTTKTNLVAAPLVEPSPRSKVTHRPVVKRYVRPSVSSRIPWAHTRDAYRVSNCESGDRHAADVNTRYNGNPHLRDGAYHGKWQMDADFWRTYGGLKYASDAADATEAEQDAVAYRGYQARGWQPWSCSGIMGVR